MRHKTSIRMIKYRKHSLVPFIIMIAKLPQKTRTMISSCQQTIKDALRELASQGAVQQDLTETVKSPFVFEFLRLDAKDIVKRYCERVRVRVSPDGSPAGVHA